MKHIFTLLILLGGLVIFLGLALLIGQIKDKLDYFVGSRPKLSKKINDVGFVIFLIVMAVSVIGSLIAGYIEIYKML